VEVNVLNIKSMSDKGLLRELAVFMFIKSQFKNSCVYDYTQQSLSDKTGISRSAVRKYVKFFLDNNWCRIHKGNLVFTGLKNFDDNKKKIITDLKIRIGIKELIVDFQLLLLKHKQAQFNRMSDYRRDLNNPSNVSQYKAALKAVKKYGYDKDKLPDANARLQISIKKLSEWLNCSVGKASMIIKKLQKRGLISVIRCKQTIMKTMCPNTIKALLSVHKGSYYRNGYVTKVCCNFYSF